MVRVTKNGAKTLLDCARQGQSHVNYAKFLSFLFQTTVIEIFSPIYILLWADLNGYIREPSDSDTVELGESWIKFNIATTWVTEQKMELKTAVQVLMINVY